MKVIEEAIEVVSYGLGPPVQMFQLTDAGATAIEPDELAGLSDAARSIREAECAHFYTSADHVSDASPEVVSQR